MIAKNWLEYLKSKRVHLALLALYLFIVIYTYLWLSQNRLPPGWDGSAHLMLSLNYFEILKQPGWDTIGRFINLSSYYPPLFEASTSILYALFGTSQNVAMMTNSMYLAILLFSTYGIGKRMFDRETAILAAFLVAMYPSVFLWQRFYMDDLALVAMVSLAIYMLLQTDHFRSFWNSIGFGIALALGMLTKWTAVLFLLGPIVCVVHDTFSAVTIDQRLRGYKKVKSCANCGKVLEKNYITYQDRDFCSSRCKKSWERGDERSGNRRKYVNLILALITAFLLASIWYIPHLQDVYQSVVIGQNAQGAVEGKPGMFTALAWVYYIISIFDLQTRMLFFILFIVGLIFFVKSDYNSKIFLALWIVIPYLVLSLFGNKNPRYTWPILVAVALISTFWITQIKNKKIKNVVILIMFLIGGIQFFSITTGKLDSLALATTVDIKGYGQFTLFPQGHLPSTDDWKNTDALEAIEKDARNNPRTRQRMAIVGVLPDENFVNGYNFAYYAMSNNLPIYSINLAYLPDARVFFENFKNFDYLVLKSGEISTPVYIDKVTAMYNFFEENNKNIYTVIQEYPIPDGSTMYIYKNIYTV